MKNVRVSDDLWKWLQFTKLDGGYSSLGNLIEELKASYEKNISGVLK